MVKTRTGTSLLGAKAEAPLSPDAAVLERVPNPQARTLYLARFTAPEFTSLCPVTGQPDFARLVIDYAPADWLIESKSLKLYLGASAITAPSTRTVRSRSARRSSRRGADWLRIGGYWYPRGGIPIDVFWQTAGRRRALAAGPGRRGLSGRG